MSLVTHPPQAEQPALPHAFRSITEAWAVHPWNGLILGVIDILLGYSDLATRRLPYVQSLLLSLALSVPVALVQRLEFGDSPKLAISKGLLLALLVVTPLPLPCVVALALGVKGAVILLRRRRAQEADVSDA